MRPGGSWQRRRARRVVVQAGVFVLVCALYLIVVTRGRVFGWAGW